MKQDDTWESNRHHSNIFPLFRNHLTRNAVAMFPLPPNPFASSEHECRDPHLPAVSHTEDAEEKRRRVFFFGRGAGVAELSNVYSTHHDYTSGATESQDAATEAANTSSQRGIRVSCVEPSSTTRARSLDPANRSKGSW